MSFTVIIIINIIIVTIPNIFIIFSRFGRTAQLFEDR